MELKEVIKHYPILKNIEGVMTVSQLTKRINSDPESKSITLPKIYPELKKLEKLGKIKIENEDVKRISITSDGIKERDAWKEVINLIDENTN